MLEIFFFPSSGIQMAVKISVVHHPSNPMTPDPVAAVVVRLSHGLMPNLFRAGQRTSLSIQVGEIGIGYGVEYPRCICQSWLAPIFRDSPSFPATTGIHADMLKTDRPLEHLSLLLCTIPA